MKTVLVPVDFSAVTNRVVAAAIKIARLLKGRIVLLHVVPPPLPIRNVLPAVEDVSLRVRSSGNEAEKKLQELRRNFARKYPELEIVHRSGAAAGVIVELAEQMAAEYIVIGSHGHSPIRDALMGSVASDVLRKATCPVLIVPPTSPISSTPTASAAESTPALSGAHI